MGKLTLRKVNLRAAVRAVQAAHFSANASRKPRSAGVDGAAADESGARSPGGDGAKAGQALQRDPPALALHLTQGKAGEHKARTTAGEAAPEVEKRTKTEADSVHFLHVHVHMSGIRNVLRATGQVSRRLGKVPQWRSAFALTRRFDLETLVRACRRARDDGMLRHEQP